MLQIELTHFLFKNKWVAKSVTLCLVYGAGWQVAGLRTDVADHQCVQTLLTQLCPPSVGVCTRTLDYAIEDLKNSLKMLTRGTLNTVKIMYLILNFKLPT